MAGERLLTYTAAAQVMGISESAFRKRVERGAVPASVLFDRPRGNNMPAERFVLEQAFRAWVGPPMAEPEEKTA